MNFFSKLKDKNYNLTGRKMLYLIISSAILLVGLIAAIAFNAVNGSPFKLGGDFAGGYVVEVRSGANITNDTYSEYRSVIKGVINDFEFTADNGKVYTLKMGKTNLLGESTETAMLVKYTIKGNKKITGDHIKDLAEELKEAIENKLNYLIPLVEETATGFKATYSESMWQNLVDDTFKNKLEDAGIIATGFDFEDDFSKVLVFTITTQGKTADDIKAALTFENTYAASVVSPGNTSPSVVNSFVFKAILSIGIAIVLIAAYMIFRFELASGVIAILMLMHDLLIALTFTVLFQIEVNLIFIAALIVVMGISLIKSALIFSRIRENRATEITRKSGATATAVANKSIIETILRGKNITITALLLIIPTLIICAAAGIAEVAMFLAPVLIGIVVSNYSSLLVSPTLWTILKRDGLGTIKYRLRSQKSKDKSGK